MARKTPCDVVTETVTQTAHSCKTCGQSFTSKQSLSRHKLHRCPFSARGSDGQKSTEDLTAKLASLEFQLSQLLEGNVKRGSATVRVTNNTQNNTHIGSVTVIAPTTNVLAVGPTTISTGPPPAGWPSSWAAPQTPPLPFPSSLTIPLEMLRRAMPSSVQETAACQRGDPKAVAALLVRIVRQVHTDPQARNIYLNPKRADQVLVYIPERWEVRPLLEAVGLVLDHVAEEIENVMQRASPPVRVVAQGARIALQARRNEVVRSSRGAMTAHLENMGALARDGEGGCWLGEVTTRAIKTRTLGNEWTGHLTCGAVVDNIERSLGVFEKQDLVGASLAVLARRMLLTYARLLLTGRPENLVVASHTQGGTACVHASHGWQHETAAGAAQRQAAAMLAALVEWFEVAEAAGAPHLAPLADYIKTHQTELAAEEGEKQEILERYARAAAAYHDAAWASCCEQEAGRRTEQMTKKLAPLQQKSLPAPKAAIELDELLAELLA